MSESLKSSINDLLSEYYKSVNEKYLSSEIELKAMHNIIKMFPFVKEIIDENNRLKFENKKLLIENEQYSKLDKENINLEINEKEEISDDEEMSDEEEELSVGGENQEDLLIN